MRIVLVFAQEPSIGEHRGERVLQNAMIWLTVAPNPVAGGEHEDVQKLNIGEQEKYWSFFIMQPYRTAYRTKYRTVYYSQAYGQDYCCPGYIGTAPHCQRK